LNLIQMSHKSVAEAMVYRHGEKGLLQNSRRPENGQRR
jgi:hypothetical protein